MLGLSRDKAMSNHPTAAHFIPLGEMTPNALNSGDAVSEPGPKCDAVQRKARIADVFPAATPAPRKTHIADIFDDAANEPHFFDSDPPDQTMKMHRITRRSATRAFVSVQFAIVLAVITGGTALVAYEWYAAHPTAQHSSGAGHHHHKR